MPKKYSIQVRRYTQGDHYVGGTFEVVETITRKPWAEMIGNFNPLFCRYKGERYQIHSDEGDVSDPFRREESYAESFFIVPCTVTRCRYCGAIKQNGKCPVGKKDCGRP